MTLKSSHLMKRLVSNFLLIAFISIAITTGISYYYSSKSLREAAFNELTAVSEIKKTQILNYINERLGDVSVLSELKDTVYAYGLLKKYHDAGGGDPNGEFDISSQAYKDIYATIGSFFNKFLSTYNYMDILFICAPHGHVMFSVKRERDLGTNLGNGPYRDSALAHLWSSIVKERKPYISDFSIYEPTGKPVQFVGAPMFDDKGNVIAVIALQLSPKKIDSIMQEKSGMGKTGESYVVGEDLNMRSNSRFEKQSTLLVKQVDTVAVQRAFKDMVGTDIIKDYRGINVLSRYSHLGLNEKFNTNFEWVIITEIDEKEAFKPVKDLGWLLILMGIVLSCIAGIVGYTAAKAIVKPIVKLSNDVVQIANGNLTITIDDSDRKDEIGVMLRSFKEMVIVLKTQTKEMIEGANTLAASIRQISTTVTQMASSSAETSSSIAEITATVEEVRQTVQMSNEKAEQVVDGAKRGAEISEEGKTATENTVNGIKIIKEEMEYIAESIVKLSEQTQSIGQIISAVNDIADQSNLLSVNASIEAAKAGEHGKGFAVVAQEVKSLAEQSKDSTNQVTTILNDIQKATSAAVMATERGGKAVETGVELSSRSGQAIQILAENVKDSSQKALQIASSSQEQMVGMDQLVDAMESIKLASQQNADGARQLEESTQNLNNLASTLTQLASRFKIHA